MASKRHAGRPTREEAARIDDVVVQGAREAFCRHGIDGASMDEIAAATGVTKQAIYRRYPSKSALLDAVVARDLGRLHAEVPATEGQTAVAALHIAARHFFDYGILPENAGFFAFLVAEAAFSDDLRARLESWSDQAIAPLLARIVAAQASGDLRTGNPACAGNLLGDLLDGAGRRLQRGIGDAFGGGCHDSFFAERWRIFLLAWGTATPAEPPPALGCG